MHFAAPPVDVNTAANSSARRARRPSPATAALASAARRADGVRHKRCAVDLAEVVDPSPAAEQTGPARRCGRSGNGAGRAARWRQVCAPVGIWKAPHTAAPPSTASAVAALSMAVVGS